MSTKARKGKGPGAIHKQTAAPGDIPGEAKLSRNALVYENHSTGTDQRQELSGKRLAGVAEAEVCGGALQKAGTRATGRPSST